MSGESFFKATSDAVDQLSAITLAEAETVKLQNRQDTKYILPASLLPEILKSISSEYRVLEIEGVRLQSYESTYYDTPERNAYLDHHNGHLNRTKIRVRNYMESEVTFFELKTKDNHMRTVKARTQVDFKSTGIPSNEQAIVAQKWKHGAEALEPALYIAFSRVMLANPEIGERVTIDLNVCFEAPDTEQQFSLEGMAIIEVKRGRRGSPSPIQMVLHNHGIPKSSMSKYCVGMALLHPGLKQNRFKPLLMKIAKIISQEVPALGIQLSALIHTRIAS